MIIDMHILLGRWPYMPLKYDTVPGVLDLMDRAKIDKGVVTSLNSVFYYDSEIGNLEVGQACLQHLDRFIQFLVLNPNLMSWKKHLHICMNKYDVKGIKLHPDYHKYSLLAEDSAKVMAEAAKYHLPVYIQTSLLDLRHHPGYSLVPEVPIMEVAQAIERYPGNTFIIGGGKHFRSRAAELIKATSQDNFYLVTDGLGGPFDGIGGLVDQIGNARLLFGSRTPVMYTEAALDVVNQSDISAEDRDMILGKNAAGLLGMAVD